MLKIVRYSLMLLGLLTSSLAGRATAAQEPIFPPYSTFVLAKSIVSGTITRLPLSIVYPSQWGWAFEVDLPHGMGEIDYAIYYYQSQAEAASKNAVLQRSQTVPVGPATHPAIAGEWYGVLANVGVAGAAFDNLAFFVSIDVTFPQSTAVSATEQHVRSWLLATVEFLVRQAQHVTPPSYLRPVRA